MLTDSHHERIELGPQMGNRGGEGTVYEVVGKPDLVAKLYHNQLSPRKLEKLMAQAKLADPELLRICAWPHSVLYKSGNPVGFMMSKVSAKPIHLLYRSPDRKDHFPQATWQHLVRVCQNLAAAFHVLHSRSILMADVNETNILVNVQGEVRFIDCDSFQFAAPS